MSNYKPISIPVPGTVEPRKSPRGRVLAHVARCGTWVEAEGATPAEARQKLAAKIEAMLDESVQEPLPFWLGPGELMLLYRQPWGAWTYSFERMPEDMLGRRGLGRRGGSTTRGAGERKETIEALEEHWYQTVVEPIVWGIAALCADWRIWDCAKCRGVSRGRAPYRCVNPICGALAAPEEQVA